jgi:hypothetical protein
VTQQNEYQPPPPGYPADQPAYGYGQPGNQPQRTNTMAILGLVFAFVFSPLGIVFSAIGLKQVKQRNEGGRGLALAGLIISILSLVLGILFLVLAATVLDDAVQAAADAEQAVSEPAVDELAPIEPAEDPTGVVAACDVIVPAVVGLEDALATVESPEGYAETMTGLGSAMEDAAAGVTDPTFVSHVQQLSADFQEAADVVLGGGDPSYLEEALTTDGTAIDDDCAAAGWTE